MMTNKKNNFAAVREKGRNYFLYLTAAAALIIRGLAFLNSDDFHGIAAGKVIEALNLIKHPDSLYSWIVPAHGPVHIYMLAVAIEIFRSPLFAAKLVSLLMGVLFFIPYYRTLRFCFDEDTAVLSLLIAVFFPLHIIYSVLSTAETSFLTFLFCGLFFFLKSGKESGNRSLVWAGVFLGLASMCRFEGGIFIILLSLFLIKTPKKSAVFFCTASILPALWLFFNQILFGDCLYFLHASDTVVKYEYSFLHAYGLNNTFLTRFFYWPLSFAHYFGAFLFMLGAAGLIFYGSKKQYRFISGLFIFVLVIFVLKTLREELALQYRYGISLAMLFIPFAAMICRDIIGKIRHPDYRRTALFALLVYLVFSSGYSLLINLPRAPLWVKESAFFIGHNLDLGENGVLFFDADDNNLKEPVKLYSGISVDKFLDYEGKGSHTELITPDKKGRLRYIILISKKREISAYREIYHNKDCKIYRVDDTDKGYN